MTISTSKAVIQGTEGKSISVLGSVKGRQRINISHILMHRCCL